MDADFGLTLCQNTDAACNARSQYHGGGTAIGKRKTEYIQIAIYGKQIFYMEQTAGKQIFYNIPYYPFQFSRFKNLLYFCRLQR